MVMGGGYQLALRTGARYVVNAEDPVTFVRRDDEYADAHIHGARHIPLPELADRLGEIKPDYVKAWWNVVNWADAADRFTTAQV